ncbi:uncharacterized protein EV422DRAFT_593037 [Fimicolochytrium jonesii]|uniref:uncharacterized protein n=1 Tax=Fimicolochytrium jonesii TaxID=1396493 RepID=UPI0022FDC14A|nr:uncharacterized protein EV422DRAFT_593037 [Fimicolochytrium jonesii]KAI8826721.1 hypothetical protein EV422DRAFT_593037 [Fimicolochytrium jonesii]
MSIPHLFLTALMVLLTAVSQNHVKRDQPTKLQYCTLLARAFDPPSRIYKPKITLAGAIPNPKSRPAWSSSPAPPYALQRSTLGPQDREEFQLEMAEEDYDQAFTEAIERENVDISEEQEIEARLGLGSGCV